MTTSIFPNLVHSKMKCALYNCNIYVDCGCDHGGIGFKCFPLKFAFAKALILTSGAE